VEYFAVLDGTLQGLLGGDGPDVFFLMRLLMGQG
jgi:hypothetical protein